MTKPNRTRRPQPSETKLFARRAPVRPASFNAEDGSFTAVIATETPVLRRDSHGEYYEVLSIKHGAVRLDRLNSGTSPILDSHRSDSARDCVGKILTARLEGRELIVTALISMRDGLNDVVAGFAGGIPPNVSVGYRVYKSTESRHADGKPIITHIDWEPFEVSLVAIPADYNAHVRNLKGATMPHDELMEDEDQAGDDTTVDNTRRGERAEERSERTMSDRDARFAYEMAERYGMPFSTARRHIDGGTSLKDFRSIALNHRAAQAAATVICSRSGDGYGETLDNPEFLSRSIESALYARMSGKPPTDAARELMGRSLLDMGSMLLQARGEKISWSNRDKLAGHVMSRLGGPHATTDFPLLLASAGNRTLQDAYLAVQTPLKALARTRDMADFRPATLIKLSEAPRLLEVAQGGEIKHGSRTEAKEGFRLKTFARIFSMTRQAIINDDLGAFADSNMAWGRAAAETEADQLVSLLLDNAGDGIKLDDGNPVYGTARGNKATAAAALSVTSLGDGRQALREMKGLDGETPISVTPKHLLVGAALETAAEQLLHELAAVETTKVNPFAGKMTLHVEPRLTGKAWRLFADPSEIATIVIGYLNGNNGPILETREGWDVLGAEFRAVLDFGCGITDWRGTYLNSGA